MCGVLNYIVEGMCYSDTGRAHRFKGEYLLQSFVNLCDRCSKHVEQRTGSIPRYIFDVVVSQNDCKAVFLVALFLCSVWIVDKVEICSRRSSLSSLIRFKLIKNPIQQCFTVLQMAFVNIRICRIELTSKSNLMLVYLTNFVV